MGFVSLDISKVLRDGCFVLQRQLVLDPTKPLTGFYLHEKYLSSGCIRAASIANLYCHLVSQVCLSSGRIHTCSLHSQIVLPLTGLLACKSAYHLVLPVVSYIYSQLYCPFLQASYLLFAAT
jgi:hypothetical protein